MSVKCSVYIAASVDGFIARPDGDVEWLERPEYTAPEAGDYGYEAFTSTVDAMVMGRLSFEKVLTFAGWPYGEMPVVVLTGGELDVPEALQDTIIVESGAPQDIVVRLAERGFRHVYVDGGVTIQRFLQAGLIDEMTITQIPVLLGDGIPLFGTLGRELLLQLTGSDSYSNGFVQNRYRVLRESAA